MSHRSLRMSASVGADVENKAKAEVNASAFVVCIGCLVGAAETAAPPDECASCLVGALVIPTDFTL